jgi:hypothetical protein
MAVYDDVALCNMALSRIGIGQQIETLDTGADTSDEVKVCAFWFEKCRDRVLSSFPWPMANKQVDLGEVEEEPNDDWGFSYRYPNDCVVARRIVSGAGTAETDPIPFDLGQDGTGRLIYTDQSEAVLDYTAWYSDAGEFPDVFASAIAYLLASEIAVPLSIDRAKAQDAGQLYLRELNKAQGIANQERRLRPVPASVFIRSRGSLPSTVLCDHREAP